MKVDYLCPTCGRQQHPGEKCKPGNAYDDKNCAACYYEGSCERHPDGLAELVREHANKRGNCRCGWKMDLLEFFDHADHLAREIRHWQSTRLECKT